MIHQKAYGALTLFLLVGCGTKDAQQPPNSNPSQPQIQPEVLIPAQGGATQTVNRLVVEETLIPPAQFGEPWKRNFQIQGDDLVGWTIEKRKVGETEWSAVGYSNLSGKFTDSDIAQDAHYRFGESFETNLRPAIFDQFLENCTNGERVYKAYRVVAAPGQIIYTGNCTFKVNAQILAMAGNVAAYPRDTVGGQNAGNFIAVAYEIVGDGGIHMAGQNGESGRDGRAGAPHSKAGGAGKNGEDGLAGNPGENGTPGKNAGRGGNIILTLAKNPPASFAYSINPGAPGRGGVGGAGGPGGAGTTVNLYKGGKNMGYEYSVTGKNGPPGPAGATAPNGLAADAGQFQLVLDLDQSAQERELMELQLQ